MSRAAYCEEVPRGGGQSTAFPNAHSCLWASSWCGNEVTAQHRCKMFPRALPTACRAATGT